MYKIINANQSCISWHVTYDATSYDKNSFAVLVPGGFLDFRLAGQNTDRMLDLWHIEILLRRLLLVVTAAARTVMRRGRRGHWRVGLHNSDGRAWVAARMTGPSCAHLGFDGRGKSQPVWRIFWKLGRWRRLRWARTVDTKLSGFGHAVYNLAVVSHLSKRG